MDEWAEAGNGLAMLALETKLEFIGFRGLGGLGVQGLGVWIGVWGDKASPSFEPCPEQAAFGWTLAPSVRQGLKSMNRKTVVQGLGFRV